jgi:hypothetical protein
VNIPLASAGYAGLGRADIPHASIISRVAMQIGGSVGTAVLAVILQHTASGARTPDALAGAFSTAFWWSVGFTAVAVPLTLLLPGRTGSAPAEPAGQEAGRPAGVEKSPAA